MTTKSGTRRTYTTDIAVLIDEVCARRNTSLFRMAVEVDCDHSYISRVRSGSRTPTRQWLERFIVRCQFTKEEAVRAYEIYRYIPPGYRVVPKAAA